MVFFHDYVGDKCVLHTWVLIVFHGGDEVEVSDFYAHVEGSILALDMVLLMYILAYKWSQMGNQGRLDSRDGRLQWYFPSFGFGSFKKVGVSDCAIFGNGRLLYWKYGASALDAFRSGSIFAYSIF